MYDYIEVNILKNKLKKTLQLNIMYQFQFYSGNERIFFSFLTALILITVAFQIISPIKPTKSHKPNKKTQEKNRNKLIKVYRVQNTITFTYPNGRKLSTTRKTG